MPTAALLLTLGGAPAALAATTGADGNSVVAAARTTEVLGPLGLFGKLSDGFFLSESTKTAASVLQVSASQAEEDAIVQLVRSEMVSTDQTTLDQLVASEKQAEALIAGAQGSLASTDQQLDALIDKYLGLSTTSDSSSATQTSSGTQSDAATAAGAKVLSVVFKVSADWVFPVQGAHSFVDSFGAPRYAGGYHTHKGTDIMCARNTPIVAVVSGVISRTHPIDSGLGGISVWLKGDDGNSYYYAHLTSIQTGIEAGVGVTAGQVIGFAGNTGDAAGGPVHLHFEIHPGGGAAIDPYLVLKGAAKISDLVTSTTTTTSTTSTTSATETTSATSTTTTEAPTSTSADGSASKTTTTASDPSATATGTSTTTTAGSTATGTSTTTTADSAATGSSATTGGTTATTDGTTTATIGAAASGGALSSGNAAPTA